MQQRATDAQDLQDVEEMGRMGKAQAQRPISQRGGRQRRPEEPSSEEPTTPPAEESASIEPTPPQAEVPSSTEGAPQPPPAARRLPASSLTIRDRETVRRLEELEKREEIQVGGTTNIEPEVIAAIAGVAARTVDGIAVLGETSLRRTIRERVGAGERRARGVAVEVGRREVIVDISIRVVYGYSIPIIVVRAREAIAGQLLTYCGLLAREINVKVTGIEFPARAPGRVQ